MSGIDLIIFGLACAIAGATISSLVIGAITSGNLQSAWLRGYRYRDKHGPPEPGERMELRG